MLLIQASAGESRIHGRGLMSRELIRANTVVWVFTPGFDVEMTCEQFDALAPADRDEIRRYVYTEKETGAIVLCADDARFMNHSDSPNTRTIGRQTIALVDISPGAEITCNYAEFDARSCASDDSGGPRF
jgi:SET domain-containing protein